MKLPNAGGRAIALFETIVPTRPDVTRRSMFGQPAAFVRGNMFCGVFGESIIVRLSDADRVAALETEGIGLFEPMPGRPMREWVALSPKVLARRDLIQSWVHRALDAGLARPPKAPQAAKTKLRSASARKRSRN